MPSLFRQRLNTTVAALIGAAAFVFLEMPLPLLLGPMAGCLAAALAGLSMRDMGMVGTFFRTFLGVAIGASVTPDLLHELPKHVYTLMVVPVYIVAIGAVGYPLFRYLMGFDHPTAFYSAMPGGLQDMLIFGEEAGGDIRALSLVHATRVLAIVTVIPFALAAFLDLDLTRPPGQPAADLPLHEVLIMIGAGYFGWKLAERVGMFGASILGPMILTAGLSLAGVLHSRPPVEMIMIAQLFIGIAIGAKYSGITGKELRTDVLAGLLFSVALSVLSVAAVLLIHRISPAPWLDILLAFLPGGQAEMALLAIVAGADVAFVIAHHILRIFVVILAAPVVERLFGRRT